MEPILVVSSRYAECAGAGDSFAHSPASGIFRDGGDLAGAGEVYGHPGVQGRPL